MASILQDAGAVRLTVLGSGTSMGVPTLGCPCRVCASTDPRDSRTRASILLTYNGRNVLVDTSPDFRAQALRAGIRRLDAVLFTHAHADHIMGLDDIRPFNLRQRAVLPIYGAPEVLESLRSTFAYIFRPAPKYNAVPLVELNAIDGPFTLFGLEIVPVAARHGEGRVLGFRFGRAAYLTDFSTVPDASKGLLEGLDDFILDALRFEPHPMHSNVEQSLALVREMKPRRAWFTHIAHDLPHADTNTYLAGKVSGTEVALSYDGLTFEVAAGETASVSVAAPAKPFKVYRSLAEFSGAHPKPAALSAAEPAARTVLTIGVFDGVHRGHQALLSRAVARAREIGAARIVLTFDPHPAKFLRPDTAPPLISTLEQRLAAFAAAGMDAALVLPFDRALSLLSPEDFVRTILVETLRARAVVVGENFRFGHKHAGDVGALRAISARMGPHQAFEVDVVPPVYLRESKRGAGGEIVSSTAVRRAIAAGGLAQARRLLGHAFVLTGEIRAGTGQGAKLVVPTLNCAPEQELLPALGVYATEVTLGGRTYCAATNVGKRPTFNGAGVTVESHLLNFSETVTAGRMEIRFLRRLREERRFPSPAALREQILGDVGKMRRMFRLLARAMMSNR